MKLDLGTGSQEGSVNEMDRAHVAHDVGKHREMIHQFRSLPILQRPARSGE